MGFLSPRAERERGEDGGEGRRGLAADARVAARIRHADLGVNGRLKVD
jgi:hypothetical protein